MTAHDTHDAAYLRAVLDNGSDAVMVLDGQAQLQYASLAAGAALGFTRDEVQNIRLLDRVHPDDIENAFEAFAGSAACGPGVKAPVEVRARHADGSWRILELIANNLLEDPAVQGIVLCLRDVTDRPEIERRIATFERRFEAAFDHAPVGRALVERDGQVSRVNAKFARLLGRPSEELVSLPLVEVFVDCPEIAPDRLALADENVRVESRLELPDGSLVWLGITVAPIHDEDGAVGNYNLFVDDVTQLRTAEHELRRAEAEFRALVANSSDIITVLEPDGSWRSSSAAGTRLLGYAEGINPEGGIFSLLHPDDVETALDAFQQLAEGRRSPDEPIVLRVSSVDGSRWFHLETVARNLVNDPAVRGIVLNSRDITERVKAEAALHRSDARFRSLVQYASDVVTVIAPDVTISYASPSIEKTLGYTPDELIGSDPLKLIHPDDQARLFEASAEAVETGHAVAVEYRAIRKDGTVCYFEGITADLSDEPSIGGFVTNARDITDRREVEREAARLTEVLERSNEVVVISDPGGELVYANQRAKEFLGLGDTHHVGELSSVESRERLRDEVMPLVRSHGLWTGELTLRTMTGNEVPTIATVQGHREQGEIVLVSTIAHDITDLKRAQHRLEYEATHDALTGLPNRAMLQEVGEQAMGRAARHKTTTGVLFLDLDGFKEVNDTLGHDAGDTVLVEIGRSLRVGVRGGDLVARLGGDEFCVLCERVESIQEVLELGQRICDLVALPMRVHGRDVRVGTSIGIALDEGGSATIGTLIRNADVALYRAKHAGGFRAELFDPAFEAEQH